MAIPKLTEESINESLKYIDEHGVPGHNGSTVYVLVVDGKKYHLSMSLVLPTISQMARR